MTDFKSISRAELEQMIGKAIHLSWARRGTVWILDRIDGDVIYLHTPKTGKRFTAKVSDAYYTRKHEPDKVYV